MIIFIYLVLGYWATGKTIYANRILLGSTYGIFQKRVLTGFILGWLLIPWALIKLIFGRS